MTVPSDRNIALKETEKKCKYKDLEVDPSFGDTMSKWKESGVTSL